MSNQIEVAGSGPQAIRLDDNEIRIGLALELEATRLQSQLEGIQKAAQLLAAQMYDKYGVTQQTHVLRDWLSGLEPVHQPDQGG